MPDASPNPFVLQGAPRAELARLCRQICLAREQRNMSPVTAEDEFLTALTTVRATYGPASINENDLKEIVATEESRVADAAVLAELISSRIAAAGQPSQPESNSVPTSPPTSIATTPTIPTATPFPTSGSTPPLSIADLIDGMLTQEKRDVRTTRNI